MKVNKDGVIVIGQFDCKLKQIGKPKDGVTSVNMTALSEEIMDTMLDRLQKDGYEPVGTIEDTTDGGKSVIYEIKHKGKFWEAYKAAKRVGRKEKQLSTLQKAKQIISGLNKIKTALEQNKANIENMRLQRGDLIKLYTEGKKDLATYGSVKEIMKKTAVDAKARAEALAEKAAEKAAAAEAAAATFDVGDGEEEEDTSFLDEV